MPDAPDELRIALLAYRGNPFCGGQGVYVRSLSRELARLGHSVEVLAGQPFPVVDDGVRLTRLPSLDLYRQPDPFRTPHWREYRDLVDLLEVAIMMTAGFPEPLTFSLRALRHLRGRRGEFDVVHDNQTLGYGLLGLQRLGFPLVTTVHHPIQVDRNLELAGARGWRRLGLHRWYGFTRMQRRVAARLPEVVTVSESSRREIVEYLGVPAERIHTIPIGADSDLFSPDPANAKVPGRIVTTASADVPLKGVLPLVEALAKVRTERHAELVVVGSPRKGGPVTAAIKRYGLEAAVRFVSGISDAELVTELRSAQVAVVPSLYEGFRFPRSRRWPAASRWSLPRVVRCPRWPAGTARPPCWCRPGTWGRWPRPSGGCSTMRSFGPVSAPPDGTACCPGSPGVRPPRLPPSGTGRP